MIGKNEELHKYLLHYSRAASNPLREVTPFKFSGPVSFLGFLVLNIVMVIGLLAWLPLYARLVYVPGFIIRGMLGAYMGLAFGTNLQLISFMISFSLAKTKVGLGLVISTFVIFFIVVLTILSQIFGKPSLDTGLRDLASCVHKPAWNLDLSSQISKKCETIGSNTTNRTSVPTVFAFYAILHCFLGLRKCSF